MNDSLIRRHRVDLENTRQLLAVSMDLLPQLMPLVPRSADNLEMVGSEATTILACAVVVAPTSSFIPSALHIAAQAQAGLFKVALAGRQTVSIPLGSDSIDIKGPVDESLVCTGMWLNAFFLNFTCQFSEQLDLLSFFPLKKLRSSSTFSSEFRHRLVSVLQSFWQRRGDVGKMIDRTRTSEKANGTSAKWIQHVGIPILQCVELLIAAPQGDIQQSLVQAIKLDNKFWGSAASARNEPEGFLAFELCGLAAAAWDRNIRFEVHSDYLHMDLVNGDLLKSKKVVLPEKWTLR